MKFSDAKKLLRAGKKMQRSSWDKEANDWIEA